MRIEWKNACKVQHPTSKKRIKRKVFCFLSFQSLDNFRLLNFKGSEWSHLYRILNRSRHSTWKTPHINKCMNTFHLRISLRSSLIETQMIQCPKKQALVLLLSQCTQWKARQSLPPFCVAMIVACQLFQEEVV